LMGIKEPQLVPARRAVPVLVRAQTGCCSAARTKATIFFATPYHAWERGLNENTNGLIRDFFPRLQTSLQSPMPRLPRSNVYSTRDPANPSASAHRKRFFTPSLTPKFLCAGYLNPGIEPFSTALKKLSRKRVSIDNQRY
jgi:hypothetical protein